MVRTGYVRYSWMVRFHSYPDFISNRNLDRYKMAQSDIVDTHPTLRWSCAWLYERLVLGYKGTKKDRRGQE